MCLVPEEFGFQRTHWKVWVSYELEIPLLLLEFLKVESYRLGECIVVFAKADDK